jgi:hypothetical protein
MNHIKNTQSICPECLQALDAEIFEDGGKVSSKKECPNMALSMNSTGRTMTSTCVPKGSVVTELA